MNLPSLHVLEEQPVLRDVEAAIAPDGDLGLMSAEEARRSATIISRCSRAIAPAPPGKTVVDKHPLHMARMPLIHRVFPDAKIVLVERHPCDAVLSCFMANFKLNHGDAQLHRPRGGGADLRRRVRRLDPGRDAAAARRPPRPLRADGRGSGGGDAAAARLPRPAPGIRDGARQPGAPRPARGHVRTASYSQVGEPIYTRAAGRWERYREQLAPVLPILAPWAERMGYASDHVIPTKVMDPDRVRDDAHVVSCSAPSPSSTLTVCPSRTSPRRIASASGSCRYFCTARFSGRAP